MRAVMAEEGDGPAPRSLQQCWVPLTTPGATATPRAGSITHLSTHQRDKFSINFPSPAPSVTAGEEERSGRPQSSV